MSLSCGSSQSSTKVFTKKYFKSVLVLGGTTGLVACQSLPAQPHSAISSNISPIIDQSLPNDLGLLNKLSPDNPLASRVAPQLSGYYPIATNANAFASRSLLIREAQHRIEVQYYIWHDDETGQLMLRELYLAANRGVKVRLLLDDMNTTATFDKTLLAFAMHPNIEVRIANPKRYRQFSALNYITQLPAINRRMHNKSMTFDGQISIVGGRNIGDEYLRNDKTTQFADLDVMVAGKVVDEVAQSFNAYWNSPISYDIETLVTQITKASKNKPVNASVTPTPASQNPQIFWQRLTKIAPLSNSNPALSKMKKDSNNALSLPNNIAYDPDWAWVDTPLLNHTLPFRWVPIHFFADPIEKLTKQSHKTDYLVHQLRCTLGTPKHQFTIVSSYFVPTELGIKQLGSLVKQGVTVQVLTNSYASTDVGAVHAGYSETRRKLLKAGVQLYELKTSANPLYQPKIGLSQSLTNPMLRNKFQNSAKRQSKRSKKIAKKIPSNISLSLHTKAFAVDENKVFIGSYNVDPRSANINTELGVVIEDPLLAGRFHDAIGEDLRSQAYQVVLSPTHLLQWITLEPTQQLAADNDPSTFTMKVYQNEPNMSVMNQLWVRIFGLLPFNWLL